MMIGTIYVLVGLIAIFGAIHVHLIQRYFRAKNKPSLYFGIAFLLFLFAAFFGILIAIATAFDNLSLATRFYQASTTSGVLGYVFLNMFAVAMTESNRKYAIWVSIISFLIITSIIWIFNPTIAGFIGGTTEFTLTSTYKTPYGLPLIEIIIALMVIIASYPVYLFFHIARKTGERTIKIKSLLMGIGLLVASNAYAIEVTDAISHQYMPIYRPMILIGSISLYFGYVMPKWMERKIIGHLPTNRETIRSFIEEFFAHPAMPIIQAHQEPFSVALRLNHQQIVGKKILFEFDPMLRYEKVIQDLVSEALANSEAVIIFTRRGNPIYSSLNKQKAVKFFCLTQQASIPRKFSKSEMLLPLSDTSLIFATLNDILKLNPEGVINIIFDNLSDLILSTNFERAYQFTKSAIEMLISRKVTALFLTNKFAHDPKVIFSLRGLFNNQIFFGKDGIEIIKIASENYFRKN